MKKLLVVVDYQNDFVSGALGFQAAEMLEKGIQTAVEDCLAAGGYVLFTRDCHPENYLETREGQHLPVPHCIQGQLGHALYGSLHQYETGAWPHVALLDKPTFGSPDIGGAVKDLCEGPPEEIELCGLVTDICVVANAILLHSFFPLARVRVRQALVGTANAVGGQAALTVLRGMGIEVS